MTRLTKKEEQRMMYNGKTEKEVLKILRDDAFYIDKIKNPPKHIQMAAVKSNFYTIRCIDNQCEEAQLWGFNYLLKLINKHGFSRRHLENYIEGNYIRNPSEKVKKEIFKFKISK